MLEPEEVAPFVHESGLLEAGALGGAGGETVEALFKYKQRISVDD